jgi:hypothetical protein
MMSGSTPNGWALPTLYSVCRDLKGLAALADVQRAERGEKPTKLEEASRLLQKCFSSCLNDRSSDITTSRKMGTYYMATLLFKTYFKLKSTALCKNIIKGIGAADLAPFDRYPLAHQVRSIVLDAHSHFADLVLIIVARSRIIITWACLRS